MSAPWNHNDYFGMANAVGSIATAFGLVYAIKQGTEARKLSNDLASERRIEKRKSFLKELFHMSFAADNTAGLPEAIAAARGAGVRVFDLITILAEVFLERGVGPNGGGIDMANCRRVGAEYLLTIDPTAGQDEVPTVEEP